MPKADDVDLGFAYSLAPEEAINYFESKGYAIGFNWHDVQTVAHAKAFTVAGVLKLDVLEDIRGGLQSALDNGDTFQQFKKELLPVLEKKGWVGKGLVADPETGELEGKQLTPRRLDTIFNTNIQSSYNAGRWKQQMDNIKDRPYLERVAIMDTHTRPKHAALNTFTARIDDPIWDVIYPPDGYGCRCRVRSRSQADVDSQGLMVQSSEGRTVEVEQEYGVPGKTVTVTGFKMADGSVYTPDPGFGFNPGKVAWQPTLEKYEYQSARQYVSGSLTGPDFALGLQNVGKLDKQQSYPLAVLSPSQREATGNGLQGVNVTAPVMQQLAASATPPAVSDYLAMQLAIENATRTLPAENGWRYAVQNGERWNVATVNTDNQLTSWDIVEELE